MTGFWRWVAALASAAAVAMAGSAAQAAEAQPATDTAIAQGTFSRGDPIPDWAHPVAIPPTKRSNPVVTRLADTQFRVGKVNSFYSNRAIQVNASAALARIGQYQLYYVPQYQKLRLHRVHLLRGDAILDRTASSNVSFLQREMDLERGVYSGGVTVALLIDDVRIGDTLHITYSIEGSNPVFGDTYSENASWDQEDPIELRSVTLSHPIERDIRWQMQGDFRSGRQEPDLTLSKTHRQLRWQETGIDGIDSEPGTPDNYFAARALQFSEYTDWSAVARWAEPLFANGGALPKEMRDLVEKLKQLPGEEARALAALRWVQEEIRYFAVTLGESSHRPNPPHVVVERRFGDCKDKTFLLLTLLRELGIEAHPLLVSQRYPKLPEKLLPTPLAFDHVMVRAKVDGQYRYLDGTRLGQRGRLTRRSAVATGMAGLAVAPGVASLASIAAPEARELNTQTLNEHFTLPSFTGDAKLETSITWNGNDAENIRIAAAQFTPEQLSKFALSNYERIYPGIELAGVPTWQDDTEGNRITLNTSYSVPKLATEYGLEWGMRFFPANLRGAVHVPPQLKRKFPLVALSSSYQAKYELTVDWPQSVAMAHDPSSKRVSNEFFSLDVTRSFRGNRARVGVTFAALTEVVQPEQLPRLMEEVKAIDQAVRGYVVVEKSAIKNDGLFGLGRKTLQENLRKRLQDTVERIGKTIADGHLSGEDLAEAHCSRAEALADLGTPADGQKDAERAVQLAPQFGRARQCRGNLYFNQGEFAKAELDFSKALALGANPFETFYRRGHARYYQGRTAEAAEDFAKAAAATDSSRRVYADLWRIWSLQRLGQVVPPDLDRQARAEPQGEWPRPALAMLVGALSPEQMLAEVEKKTGDERELNMTEALFYLGQQRLNQGQPTLARTAFEQVRQKGITMYIEHVAAGFELSAKTMPAPDKK